MQAILTFLTGLTSSWNQISLIANLVLLLGTLSTIPLGCGYCNTQRELLAKKREVGFLKEQVRSAKADTEAVRVELGNQISLRKTKEVEVGICEDRERKLSFTCKINLQQERLSCEEGKRREAEFRMRKVRDLIKSFNPHTNDPELQKKCPQKEPVDLMNCLVRFILTDA